jgi:FtsP/CotA-like multicopper oxidase with cupredoxin domain
MVPGDRLDFVITGTAAPATSVPLMNLPYSRGHGDGVAVSTPVLQLAYTPDVAVDVLPLPTALGGAITPTPVDGISPRTITLDETVDPVTGASTFTINGASYPNVPPIDTHVGTTEVWDLVNHSAMDHPFHLHGFPFQVVSQDGMPPPFASWEDTFNLRGHTTTRIVFRPDDRPGMWMYHCHILEHAAYGMMADVNVMQ